MSDNIAQAGTVNESMHSVTRATPFSPGVYFVTLTVAGGGCGGSATASTVDGLSAMVVIYDPNGAS